MFFKFSFSSFPLLSLFLLPVFQNQIPCLELALGKLLLQRLEMLLLGINIQDKACPRTTLLPESQRISFYSGTQQSG